MDSPHSPQAEKGLSSWLKRRKRFSTPTVIQMEAIECGAAALCMIMAYHGRWVTLEQMRIDCGVSRDGSKASNLLKAARRYGLISRGHRPEIEDLRKLPFPLIAFWNFNHFVVVEGYDPKTWYLNDPAAGPRKVGLEEFEDSFSNVAMTSSQDPAFRQVAKGRAC